MEKHALDILEFDKFLEIVAKFAQLSTTKRLIKTLTFYSKDDLEKQFSLIDSINEIREFFPLPGIQAYSPIITFLEELKYENSYPQPKEAANLASFLALSGNLKNWFDTVEKKQPENTKKLNEIFNNIIQLDWLYDKINRIVDDKFKIKNNASKKLLTIRNNIGDATKSINSTLQNIIHKPNNEAYIQEKIVTIRDNRFVIPVKSSHRSKISGFIHDQSTSGETVFIEPAAVLSLNNKLKTLYFEEDSEIRAILTDLGNDIRSIIDELKNIEDAIIKFDFLQTKVRFHDAFQCSKANFTDKIELKDVRHPLLGDNAVPIDISFGGKNNTLIISGPNTGGKTVSLKTLGLISLIAQAGYFIPATKSSTIKHFSEIYCDIGDEQSIEDNLSTFSSHISNIAHIFSKADKNSLVIIDEPGAGTDPEEGSILGISILKELLKREITTITTTHYNKIKNWGFTTENVENGSIKFEPEKLIPSYKISYKIPGASHAFEIAAQLGMPSIIIDECHKLVDPEIGKTNNLLNSLEKKISLFEAKEDKLKQQQQKYEDKTAEYNLKLEKINTKKEKILTEAKNEKERIIKKGKEKVDKLIRQLKSTNQPISAKEESLIKNALKLKKQDTPFSIENIGETENDIKIDTLNTGDKVEIISLGKIGKISKINKSKKELSVALGNIEMVIKLNNIKLIIEPNSNKSRALRNFPHLLKPSFQLLDIRGERFEEAQVLISKFFDNAISSESTHLSIIHGKGTGALQEAVREVIKEYPTIKFMGFARPENGGAGRSEIEIKK